MNELNGLTDWTFLTIVENSPVNHDVGRGNCHDASDSLCLHDICLSIIMDSFPKTSLSTQSFTRSNFHVAGVIGFVGVFYDARDY
jgi:hypothetical protein